MIVIDRNEGRLKERKRGTDRDREGAIRERERERGLYEREGGCKREKGRTESVLHCHNLLVIIMCIANTTLIEAELGQPLLLNCSTVTAIGYATHIWLHNDTPVIDEVIN